jgi:hypothetical protein
METLNRDSQHQQLVDAAYRGWVDDSSYPDFIESLDPTHRAAVLTANLNEQVVSGGFHGWHTHGFSSCGEQLLEVLSDIELEIRDGVTYRIRDIVNRAWLNSRLFREGMVPEFEGYRQAQAEFTAIYLRLCSAFMAEVEVYLMRKMTPMRRSA